MKNSVLKIFSIIISLTMVSIASSYITMYTLQRNSNACFVIDSCKIAKTELLALEQLKKGQQDLAVTTLEMQVYSELLKLANHSPSAELIKEDVKEFIRQLQRSGRQYPGNNLVLKKEAEDFIKTYNCQKNNIKER